MIEFILKAIKILFIEEFFVLLPLLLLFYYLFFSIFLRRERPVLIQFLIIVLPFIFIFYHYSYLSNFFSALGQDSILEIDTNVGESLFYIKTFFYFLFDPEIFKRNRFWLLLGSSIGLSFMIFLITIYYSKKLNINLDKINKFFNYIFIVSLIFVLILGVNFFKINYEFGKQLKNMEVEFRDAISKYESKRKKNDDLKVITYIGESTSALNLSLYGYPFQTTPWLENQSKKSGFIKFSSVFSTHTHSTQSLTDAFSLCGEINEKNCLGFENLKNKISILDILSKSKIDTNLYSAQGSLGGHNLASRLVLNAKNTIIASDTNNEKINRENLLGNRFNTKIKDKDFFLNSFCKNKKLFSSKKPSLTLLHSYAGHGQFNGYLNHIPKREIFKYPAYVNKKNFLGNDFKNFRLINEYDTAINYIDSTLSEVINCSFTNIKKTNKPLIFIYFSDHGESPATSRGHDSTRATYEMLHIPFFIFFNDEAEKQLKEKLDFFKSIKDKNLTLNTLSEILIYLFDIDIKASDNTKIFYSDNKFKSFSNNFILSRKEIDGKKTKLQTFFNYKGDLQKSEFDEDQYNKNDTSINLWQLSNYLETKNLTRKEKIENMVCQHRANSLITQFKSSLSNGCFETDIFFNKDNTLSTHGMDINTNLVFDNFLKSSYKKNTVWIDGKNLDITKNCLYGYQWLNKNSSYFESMLIEIPTSSIENIKNLEWVDCINKISNIKNIQVAYYLPTYMLSDCSKKKINKLDCERTFSEIVDFLNELNIRSITFDYIGFDFIKNFKPFNKFKWNIWHVNSLRSFKKIFQNTNIGIVLLKNNKFTNNLN